MQAGTQGRAAPEVAADNATCQASAPGLTAVGPKGSSSSPAIGSVCGIPALSSPADKEVRDVGDTSEVRAASHSPGIQNHSSQGGQASGVTASGEHWMTHVMKKDTHSHTLIQKLC